MNEIRLAPAEARDWLEDSHLENGNYNCRCGSCGEIFIGHKRRPFCKSCAEDIELGREREDTDTTSVVPLLVCVPLIAAAFAGLYYIGGGFSQ